MKGPPKRRTVLHRNGSTLADGKVIGNTPTLDATPRTLQGFGSAPPRRLAPGALAGRQRRRARRPARVAPRPGRLVQRVQPRLVVVAGRLRPGVVARELGGVGDGVLERDAAAVGVEDVAPPDDAVARDPGVAVRRRRLEHVVARVGRRVRVAQGAVLGQLLGHAGQECRAPRLGRVGRRRRRRQPEGHPGGGGLLHLEGGEAAAEAEAVATGAAEAAEGGR